MVKEYKSKEFFIQVSESIAKYKHTGIKDQPQLVRSSDTYNILKEIYDGDFYDCEKAYILFLSRSNHLIDSMLISMGGLTGTVIDCKKIFREALIRKSCGIIVCHNHPSGKCLPSQSDKDLTCKMKLAGDVVDIQVMDHLILTGDGYYSFADEGLL
jgi:DNA repair protein RadC